LLTAQLLEKLEQYELAIAVYDGMSRDHPSYLNAEIGRAEALYEAGKPDAAIEVLMQLGRNPFGPAIGAHHLGRHLPPHVRI
jgi:predicted Zn-dependent protease